MELTKPAIGVGLYSTAEASRLLGVPPSTIGKWLRSGMVNRYFEPAEKTVTFAELMELYFIRLFRNEGVPLKIVKMCYDRASSDFGTDRPFLLKRFDTDGRTIFATMEREAAGKVLVQDLHKGQLVFRDVVTPFFKKLDYTKAEEVGRFWPMEKQGGVVLDPHRKFGKPIVDEFDMPTSVLYEATRAGKGQDPKTVAWWLGVSVEAVKAAVEFEESLLSNAA